MEKRRQNYSSSQCDSGCSKNATSSGYRNTNTGGNKTQSVYWVKQCNITETQPELAVTHERGSSCSWNSTKQLQRRIILNQPDCWMLHDRIGLWFSSFFDIRMRSRYGRAEKRLDNIRNSSSVSYQLESISICNQHENHHELNNITNLVL